MMGLAWLCSSKRNAINLRLIVTGVLLQFAMGILILRTTPGMVVFDVARTIANQIVGFSDQGAEFVFGEGFREHFFAFSVLPIIIFMSSLMAVLYHLGIIQKVVQGMAWLMVRVMDVSGTESLSAAANVFFGQTEAPLAIKPYLNTMTRSELMAMMTGGMATIAGSVMGAYVAMGIDAGHLLSASLMSAPASLVIAKIMIPETEDSPTKGVVRISVPRTDENLLDAACRGAGEGLQLALNVAAMIIAFIALVAMLNWVIGLLPAVQGAPLSLERILGWICSPLAWLMGIQWSDATTVGQLLGERTVLNEFIAYLNLADLKEAVEPRSYAIATYALCGFANFASIAIQIGGIGALAPDRRKDFASLGFRSMVGGTLAAYMTACIAGMLL
jgi:CNT family concentrative nucleoside transporter